MAGQIINRGKSTWVVRVYLGRDPQTGKREYANETVHGNKKDAQQKANEMLGARDRGEIAAGARRAMIGGLLDLLLTDYKINGKDYEWARLIVERQLRPFFGDIPIPRLNSDQIARFIRERHDAGRANATINNELALLRRSLSLGMKTSPPKVLRAPRIEKLRVSNVRKGFFEHPEYLALRKALPDELKPILTFGYYTGCRKGEILSLQWPQVDLTAGVVRLEPGTTKNDEARLIPIAGELYEVLSIQKDLRDARYPDCPWVFFRKGRPIIEFKNAWTAGCAAAKVEGKLFHDLRRTGVRNLVRAGVPEKVAQQISGHKTRAVFDRYNIVSESDLKAGMIRLAEYHRENTRKAAEERESKAPDSRHTIGTQQEKQASRPGASNPSKLLN